MQKKMKEIMVSTTTEGMIEIEQQEAGMEDRNLIEICPEQVDTLISWLMEAVQELHDEHKAELDAIEMPPVPIEEAMKKGKK